jgi:hypothetical protein
MGGTDKSSSLRFVEGDSTSILEYQESRIALTIVNPSMELCPSEQPDWHGAKLTAFFNAHLGKFIVTCLTTLPRTITRPCSSSSAGMAAIRLLWQIPANVRCQRGRPDDAATKSWSLRASATAGRPLGGCRHSSFMPERRRVVESAGAEEQVVGGVWKTLQYERPDIGAAHHEREPTMATQRV